MAIELVAKIIDKLKLSNIKKIVSIDDGWKPKKIEIDMSTELNSFIDLKKIRIPEKVKIELNNESDIVTLEDLFSNENIKLDDFRTKILKYITPQPKLDETLLSLNTLLTEIKKEYPEIVIEKISEVVVDFSINTENCLYILDKNMGGKSIDVVAQSIFDINSSGQTKDDIVLIYSSESVNEFQNNSTKLDYIEGKNLSEKDSNLLIYKMWAIAKSGDFNELLPAVYKMLLKSMYGNALYRIIQFKLKVEDEAYGNLLKIDTQELSDSIKDSFIEGDNIVQTLDRVYLGLKNKIECETSNDLHMESIEALISYERENIEEEFLRIKEESLAQATGANLSEKPYEKLRNMRTKEKLMQARSERSTAHYNIVDYSINKVYADLATGDIFKFKQTESGKEKFGILISQSCNCVIRILNNENINLVDRLNKQMKILILDADEIKQTISDNKMKGLIKYISGYIWPVKIQDKTYILKPSDKTISFDDFILDLCTLNKNGKGSLNFNINEALNYKSFHSHKYFLSFKDKYFGDQFYKAGNYILKNYEEVLNTLYNQARQEVMCTLDCINSQNNQEPFTELRTKVFNQTISLKYSLIFENNEFSIERIGRLEPKRTLLVIQDMVNKLSKVGADPITSVII